MTSPDPGAPAARAGTKAAQARRCRDLETYLPGSGMSLEDARRQLSARHFAKEALALDELELLSIAEGLMRLIDGEQG
jgi:hypothetical protein